MKLPNWHRVTYERFLYDGKIDINEKILRFTMKLFWEFKRKKKYFLKVLCSFNFYGIYTKMYYI